VIELFNFTFITNIAITELELYETILHSPKPSSLLSWIF